MTNQGGKCVTRIPKGVINEELPHLLHCLPYFQAQPREKTNSKGTAFKVQQPFHKRKKLPLSIRLQHLAKPSLCCVAALHSIRIVRPVLQQRLVVGRPNL